MTEDEWFAASNPLHLWRQVFATLSRRQTILLAVAACRVIPASLLNPAAEGWIAACERMAEQPGVRIGAAALRGRVGRLTEGVAQSNESRSAVLALCCLAREAVDAVIVNVASTRGTRSQQWDVTDPLMAALMRDIVGNPFYPVTFALEWRTETVVLLARQMYESRDFSAMPILADALQDAGCNNDEILAHCRDPQQGHVRGCWVVDLVLGKN
jgi:hypothetical protein